MPRKKRAGRPKGSKSKNKITSELDVIDNTPKRRGRPAGIPSKRSGKTIASSSIVTSGGASGIHVIGRTLIIDTMKWVLMK